MQCSAGPVHEIHRLLLAARLDMTRPCVLLQVDGVIELLEFHLDEDLKYKMHWHLQQANGQIHITEFVEYLCCQHLRIHAAKEGEVYIDALQTPMEERAEKLMRFSNPIADMTKSPDAE